MEEQLRELFRKAFNEGVMYEATLSNAFTFDSFIEDNIEQLRLYGVVKSLPTKIIIDYLERSEDFYIDDSEIANRFYNAALNDVKYFIEKEEEKLK